MFRQLFFILAVESARAITCHDGSGGFTQAEFPHCLSPAPGIFVYSGMSSDSQYLKLGLFAENHTNAWSALGFGGNGGMKGASQIVVRQEAGQWVAEDRHSLDYVIPEMDAQQDATLIWAVDDGKHTAWAVLLRNNSCDIDDYPVDDASRYFLWALGSSHTFAQHAKRGQFHANLVSGTPAQTAPTDVSYVDLLMPNVEVKLGAGATGDASNPYICGLFNMQVALPSVHFNDSSVKVHVAEFTPALDASSSSLVHHMILYACNSDAARENNFTHRGVIANCESMPPGCYDFKWPWAVGSLPVVFPENIGMPIGEGSYWLALQVHYYNPTRANVRDNSGVRMAIANQLRSIDAGVYQFNGGTSPDGRDAIPAGQADVLLDPAWAPAICTNAWTGPVHMLGVVHHMHLTGTNMLIEVERNGEYIGPLRLERRYDFQHQSLEESRIKTLWPGDQIRQKCTYNTMAKTEETVFGELTQNEMCWAAFIYYPRQEHSQLYYQRHDQANLQPFVTPCLTPAPSPYDGQGVSMCAFLYASDLGTFFGGDSTGPAHTACNLAYAQVPAGLCPPCGATASCTEVDTGMYAQHTICPSVCSPQFNVTVWPDTNDTNIDWPTQRSYCSAVGANLMSRPVMPPAPACAPAGNLSSTQAQALVNQVRAARATSAPTPAGSPTTGDASRPSSSLFALVVAVVCLAAFF